MPTPTTTVDIFDVLSRSGLFTPESLSTYVRLYESINPPPKPEVILRRMVDDGAVTPFQARFLLAGRFKGFFLGDKYKLLANIGTGGMGDVFLAEHLLLHRLVAIKILKSTDGRPDSSGAIERFFREARAAAALRHPNIAQLYDVDRNGTTPYMVMEYLDGTTLHTVGSEHGPLSVARAVNYTVQVARGLRHAHENGLIHRDIKPGNLILDRDGTVKILDLGLARFHQDTSKNNNLTARFDDNNLVGTADFIAPEQTHDSSAVDGRADIYSLGCTLYFLLTGQAPYQDGSIAQKLLWHQLKPAPPVGNFRKDVPADLLGVLNAMMAKDPAQRIQSAAEVATALSPWFEPGLAPPLSREMPERSASSYRLGLIPDAPGRSDGTSRTMPNLTLPETGETPTLGFDSWNPKSPAGIEDDTVPTSGAATVNRPRASEPKAPPVIPVKRTRRWLYFGAIQVILLGATISTVLYLNKWSNSQTTLPAGRKALEQAPPDDEIKVEFRGGGSSFIAELMEGWKHNYPQQSRVAFDYKSVGSGDGKAKLFDGTYDFACIDAFLTDEEEKSQISSGRHYVHIPLTMGGVVAAYNLPGKKRKIRFSGPLLSAIFRGEIRNWNDDRIRDENGGEDFPDQKIEVIYREDKSGTTSIWTEFLSSADPKGWGAHFKKLDLHPATLEGKRGKKNEGVADLINETVGSIGYVELNVAMKKGLAFGLIQNSSKNYQHPNPDTITKAAENMPVPGHLKYSIVNSPGEGGYPISGFTWAVFDANMADKQKRQAIMDFLAWALNEGQKSANQLNYGKLPDVVKLASEGLLNRVKNK